MDFTWLLKTYCNLLEEIKIRDRAIRVMIKVPAPIPSQILYENCHLQMRMICELIALGCLLVHGDIEGTQRGRLRKAYAADFILNALEALHPDFYPQPGQQVVVDGKVKSVEKIKSGFLSKTDLIQLYVRCGQICHRGSARDVLQKFDPAKVSFDEIETHLRAITRLLNHHQIALYDNKNMVWALMQSDKDGKPHTFLMTRVED